MVRDLMYCGRRLALVSWWATDQGDWGRGFGSMHGEESAWRVGSARGLLRGEALGKFQGRVGGGFLALAEDQADKHPEIPPE